MTTFTFLRMALRMFDSALRQRAFRLCALPLVFGFLFLSLPRTTFAQGKPDLVWMRGGHASLVKAVAYSPDGKLFASGAGDANGDNTVKIWRLSDGMLLRTFVHNGGVTAVLFSPDSNVVIAADTSRNVRMWRVSDGTLLDTLTSFAGDINSIALSPNGQLLATGSSDHLIQLWRTSDGTLLNTLVGHTQAVFSLAFSPDGQTLASASGYMTTSYGGDDNTIRLWRLSDGALLRTLFGPTESRQYKIAFSPDGTNLLVCQLGGNSFQVFRSSDGVLLRTVRLPIDSAVNVVNFALSPNGQQIAVLLAWTVYTPWWSSTYFEFRGIRTSDWNQIWASGGRGGGLTSAPVFSPDGTTIAAGAGELVGSPIGFWRATDGALLPTSVTPPGPGGPIRIAEISPDGQLMADASFPHGHLLLRRVSDGMVVGDLLNPGGSGSIEDVAFSPDSGFIAVAATSFLGLLRVSDGQVVRTFSTNSGDAGGGVAFSPDGQWIASGNGKIFRVADGVLIRSLNAYGRVAFSPDGKVLAIGTNLYRTSDWTLLRTLGATTFAFLKDLAFSPDGRMIALAGGSTNSRFGGGFGIDLFNVETGARIRSLPNDIDVVSVAFSPDGEVIASGDTKARLTLWYVRNGTRLISYDQETGTRDHWVADQRGVISLAYTPDSKFLAYGRSDGTLALVLNPYRNAIFPSRGGNTGNVTIKIITALDFPVSEGASIALRDGVNPDITLAASKVSSYVLTGTFDLRGAPPGKRDVVITVEGVGKRIYPQGFTIEQGVEPTLSASTLGWRTFRSNRPQPGYIVVQNLGNVDAPPVSATLQFSNSLAWVLNDASPSEIFVGGHATSLAFNTVPVPAGSTVVSPAVTLRAPGHTLDGQAVQVSAWTTPAGRPRITYIGNLTEELVFRAIDASGNRVEFRGPLTGGHVSDISNIRVTNPGGQTFQMVLNGFGLPISAFDFAGSGMTFGYPDATTVTLSPFYEGVPAYNPIPFPLFNPPPPPPPIRMPNLTPGSGGTYDPCNLAEICYSIDRFLQAQNANYLRQASGLLTATRLTGAVLASNGLSGLVIGAITSPSFSLIAAVVSLDGLLVGEQTFRHLGDLLWNLNDCVPVISSADPNELNGPVGYGAPQWLPATRPLPYTLQFENLPTATAPAAEVVATAHLDPATLDLTSLQLGDIRFAGKSLTPAFETALPVGKREFTADVDLRPGKPFLVRVHASLDMLTGDLTSTFTTLDAATGLPLAPDDPRGFLDPGQGGSILFSVTPKAGVATGTVTRSMGTIVFDYNDPIDTNAWSNTLDADHPLSLVQPLPPTQSRVSFPMSWAGADVGSGVRDYTIFVSDNGGPLTSWLPNTTDTKATFTGQPGHTYAFKSRARDNVYNVEEEHAQPDTLTSIPPLATNVSAQVRVAAGSFRYDGTNGRFYQTVTLQNISRGTIQAPISLALDSLSSGAKLVNQSGVTLLGGPYINMPAGNGLGVGQKATLVLEFTSVRNRPITYNTRVLAGPGLR